MAAKTDAPLLRDMTRNLLLAGRQWRKIATVLGEHPRRGKVRVAELGQLGGEVGTPAQAGGVVRHERRL